MWGVRRDESTRIAQVTNSTEHPLLTVCRSWKPWSPNEWLRCDHVWRPILGASMGHNLQQGLTILTGIMIILCCILQCYVYFCFFVTPPHNLILRGLFSIFFRGPVSFIFIVWNQAWRKGEAEWRLRTSQKEALFSRAFWGRMSKCCC